MKRKWTTQLKGTGSTPAEALADLLEDRLALMITAAVYMHPLHDHSLEMLQTPEEDRRIIGWEAQTTVTMLGELMEDDHD